MSSAFNNWTINVNPPTKPNPEAAERMARRVTCEDPTLLDTRLKNYIYEDAPHYDYKTMDPITGKQRPRISCKTFDTLLIFYEGVRYYFDTDLPIKLFQRMRFTDLLTFWEFNDSYEEIDWRPPCSTGEDYYAG